MNKSVDAQSIAKTIRNPAISIHASFFPAYLNVIQYDKNIMTGINKIQMETPHL
jgi:formyltetrahydrofolate hydrolase